MEIVLDESVEFPRLALGQSGIRLVMNPGSDMSVVLQSFGLSLPECARLDLMRLWNDPTCQRAFEAGPGWVRIYDPTLGASNQELLRHA